MMKSNKLILIIALVVLIAGAGFLYFKSSGSSLNPLSQDPMKDMEKAISGSGSVKCEFVDEEGRNITSYVKDGKIRVDSTGGVDEEERSMIFKGENIWTWDVVSKQGFTMSVPEDDPESDIEATEGDTGQEEALSERDKIQSEIEKYKESCKNESISDSLFEAPSDVTFQDMSYFLKALPDMPTQY